MPSKPPKTSAQTEIIDTSDMALAHVLLRHNGARIRYVAQWGRWIVWNGKKWQVDDCHETEDMASDVIRDAADRLEKQRIASLLAEHGRFEITPKDNEDDKAYKRRKARSSAVDSVTRIRSASKQRGVMQIAETTFSINVPVSDLDSDVWLLNTPRGIIDLRNASLHNHNPKHMMTKITRAGPVDAKPMRWLQFLDEITAGDADLQAYLQRVAGYCLTGTTQSQTLFFGFGSGQNGKSVFVNTLAHIMGDYSQNAAIETFLDMGPNKNYTEVANLQGARFVTASETQAGRMWNESRIKQMTGGDPITARFLYKDVFTYMPQFKLFLVGNHRPKLSYVNEAIRRRMQLIPFTVHFAERDEGLFDQFTQHEAEGIMQWMVEGCAMYNRDGLAPPAAVINATNEYLTTEDSMAQWLEDCCSWDVNARTPATALFSSWTRWAIKRNEKIGNNKEFKLALFEHCGNNYLKHGVARVEGKHTQCYEGIALLEPEIKKAASRSHSEVE